MKRTPGLSLIADNLARVRDRLSRAVQRSGRRPEEVGLLGVTKTVPAGHVQEAWDCGLRNFGENKVQEALEKISRLKTSRSMEGAAWHMLGHLQTNKAAKAADVFNMIQSLDSLRLAGFLDKAAKKQGRPLSCLVEVKVSEEPSKTGASPDGLEQFLTELNQFSHLRVEGLMTVAPYFDHPEKTRPFFKRMRALFDRHKRLFQSEHPILSMGMSQDFEVAIEEGATLVRLGTALFGERRAAP